MSGVAPAAPKRPALRYPGGKFRDRRWIVSNLPPHGRYTEGCGGAASVLLAKAPAPHGEVYNDLDGRVVSLFRVLRDPAASERLREVLRLTPYARAEFEAAREVAADPVEDARRLLVRAYMGRGSDAAAGAQTGFRTGMRPGKAPAARDWSNYPDAIEAFRARLAGVVVECRCVGAVVEAYDGPDVLHYLDPPYPAHVRSPHSHRTGKGYRHEMPVGSPSEHRDEEGRLTHYGLAAVAHAAVGMVVISGYASDLYDQELFPGWTRLVRPTHGDAALPRTEVLWLNLAAARALEAS